MQLAGVRHLPGRMAASPKPSMGTLFRSTNASRPNTQGRWKRCAPRRSCRRRPSLNQVQSDVGPALAAVSGEAAVVLVAPLLALRVITRCGELSGLLCCDLCPTRSRSKDRHIAARENLQRPVDLSGAVELSGRAGNEPLRQH